VSCKPFLTGFFIVISCYSLHSSDSQMALSRVVSSSDRTRSLDGENKEVGELFNSDQQMPSCEHFFRCSGLDKECKQMERKIQELENEKTQFLGRSQEMAKRILELKKEKKEMERVHIKDKLNRAGSYQLLILLVSTGTFVLGMHIGGFFQDKK
jgi:TolA-binding protein